MNDDNAPNGWNLAQNISIAFLDDGKTLVTQLDISICLPLTYPLLVSSVFNTKPNLIKF